MCEKLNQPYKQSIDVIERQQKPGIRKSKNGLKISTIFGRSVTAFRQRCSWFSLTVESFIMA